MQVQPFQLTGLLGAVVLSAGLASSMAIADDSTESAKEQPSNQVDLAEEQVESQDAQDEKAQSEEKDDDMVEVRISMPDGRVIIRRESARKSSARRTLPASSRVSRTLPDGSRISYGHRGVSGGSNGSSVRSGGSHASGGGGGGSSSHGGGGGGSAKDSRSNVSLSTAMGEGAQEAELLTSEQSESTASLTPRSFQSDVANQSSSSGSGSTGSSTSNTGSSSSSSGARSVPTIGGAQYSQDGAVGGQRVEFHDAGMGAAVVGNTVYFIGVELVQSDQGFEVVTGTQVGGDSVMMDGTRRSSSSSDFISSWNTGESTIKLDFPSDTIVELRMFSQPVDASHPDREERTWTVRIR